MSEFRTFLFIGISFALGFALLDMSWALFDTVAAYEAFPYFEPVAQLSDPIPVIGSLFACVPTAADCNLSFLYLLLSLFTIETPSAVLSAVISNGFIFVIMYMVYLFLKDRGI